MSASVASSAVGLLDRRYSPQPSSPDAFSTSHAPDWHDPMDLDHPPQSETEQPVPQEAPPKQPVEDDAGNYDRQDTLGGLLATLATNSSNQSTTQPAAPAINTGASLVSQAGDDATTASVAVVTSPRAMTKRKSVSPPADSPISEAWQPDLAEGAQEASATTPNDTSGKVTVPDSLQATNPAEPNYHSTSSDIPNIPASTMPENALIPEISEEDLEAMRRYQEENPIPADALEAAMPLDPFPDYAPDRPATPITIKRKFNAFARLVFADGIFYMNTFACEIGRDQHAYKDALKREKEARKNAEMSQPKPQSSSGKAPSHRVRSIRAAESQVQRSVVSDSGGFAGVDENLAEDQKDKHNGQNGNHESSKDSESSIVRPSEVLHNPSLAPYDYHKDVIYQPADPVPEDDVYDDERPAPVTEDHMPDPNLCPLLPIHPTMDTEDQTEVQAMKMISRRHIKISWDYKEQAFCMTVLGRNGAFFDNEHYVCGERVKLYSGGVVQISAVQFIFDLPAVKAPSPGDDDENVLHGDNLAASPNGDPQSWENGQPVKLKLKLNADPTNAQSASAAGEQKRRGPGRPPKNGVMSQREMKEREKADKEAKARALHSGLPESAPQRKPSKSQAAERENVPDTVKQEVRKYTKRKREDGEEEETILPSIETREEGVIPDAPLVAAPAPPPPPPPPAKRARTKSFSPPYKPYDQCTPEDLARPPHNYAVLLYMVLSETGEITLRQIYKQMQARWPFFKYVVDSDGWTSSVRHNLNQEVGKLFERGRKEGKGFTWLPKPNAMEEYQAQKNKRSNAPPVPKPRPQAQRSNYPPNQGQQLTWQNNGPMPQNSKPGNGYTPGGPWNGPPGSRPQSGPPGPNGQSPAPPGLNLHPNFVPEDKDLHKYLNHPSPRFMPVTFQGLAVINRFQETMMSHLGKTEESHRRWDEIFRSVRSRCLHGAPESSVTGGETSDERMIIGHIDKFVQTYKNPNFQSFLPRNNGPNVPNGSTAPSSESIQQPANEGGPALPGPSVDMQNPLANAPSTGQDVQHATEVSQAVTAHKDLQTPVTDVGQVNNVPQPNGTTTVLPSTPSTSNDSITQDTSNRTVQTQATITTMPVIQTSTAPSIQVDSSISTLPASIDRAMATPDASHSHPVEKALPQPHVEVADGFAEQKPATEGSSTTKAAESQLVATSDSVHAAANQPLGPTTPPQDPVARLPVPHRDPPIDQATGPVSDAPQSIPEGAPVVDPPNEVSAPALPVLDTVTEQKDGGSSNVASTGKNNDSPSKATEETAR